MQLLFSRFKQYFADSEKTSFLVNIKLARDLRAVEVEVVKPTLKNKSCSNQKINATLLLQF